jgi:hypothetical protein
MSTPGFTAEASLYRTNDHYKLTDSWTNGIVGQEIIPQRIKLTEVRCVCDNATDICVCDNGRVFSNTLGDLRIGR